MSTDDNKAYTIVCIYLFLYGRRLYIQIDFTHSYSLFNCIHFVFVVKPKAYILLVAVCGPL
jgi:hypothetical protein